MRTNRHATGTTKRIDINGIVQGVGFRPFVYQLARAHALTGQVANTASGVIIHVSGPPAAIDGFYQEIPRKAPPLAHITRIAIHAHPDTAYADFSIVKSEAGNTRFTLISPDMSVCEDCLQELFDPNDRRYRYPFINCTNCGPRYTIIDDIPYDRPKTSMKHFPMCARCQAEYEDPENRRFHAQPNACPVCGPQVSLYDAGRRRINAADPIADTAALLQKGKIVAVKGLGGFHLAVDAGNDAAVIRLRRRKQREAKPLAVMARDPAAVARFAHLAPETEALLCTRHRPIVLLPKRSTTLLSAAVAPANRYVGVMLPYTPLHYLLLAQDLTALVMTSGNLSDEPIAVDNDDAFTRLKDVADFFLIHNRDIYLRTDDSVTAVVERQTRFLRRSRGYVPAPVFLKDKTAPILACGAELKNTICLTRGEHAFLSQHIGDLENAATYDFFLHTIAHLRRILDVDPQCAAYDLHPDYLSTKYALSSGLEKIAVQHHHAHIVSCMAENRIEGPVLGLACDGTGYGTDGAVWGGEFMVAEAHRFDRVGHLAYVPMPGGAAAIREPWRMALSYLIDAFGEEGADLPLPFLKRIDAQKRNTVIQMLHRRFNAPLTSSLGRLFDGVAAITGLRNIIAFEGQAAMELEMAAAEETRKTYEYQWRDGPPLQIETRPIIKGVVRDVIEGVAADAVSATFHRTLAVMFGDVCKRLKRETGLARVVLSGGVFQNSRLLSQLLRELDAKEFAVYSHTIVPTNDGGIALGQAVAADAVLKRGR